MLKEIINQSLTNVNNITCVNTKNVSNISSKSYLKLCENYNKKLIVNLSFQNEFYNKNFIEHLFKAKYLSHGKYYRTFTNLDILLLKHINKWISEKALSKNSNKVFKGQIYMFNTINKISKLLKVSESAVKKRLAYLNKANFISKGQFHLDQTNRVNFYTINYMNIFSECNYDLPIKLLKKYTEAYVEKVENYIDLQPRNKESFEGVSHGVKVTPSIIQEKTLIKNNKKIVNLKQGYNKLNKFGYYIGQKFNVFEKIIYYLNNFYQSGLMETNYRKNIRTGIYDRYEAKSSREIQEIFHNESLFCTKIRTELREYLGNSLYLSWFNNVKFSFDNINSQLHITGNNKFQLEQIKVKYLQVIEEITKDYKLNSIIIDLSPLQKEKILNYVECNYKDENVVCKAARLALINNLNEEEYNLIKNSKFSNSRRCRGSLKIYIKPQQYQLISDKVKLKSIILENIKHLKIDEINFFIE